MSKRHLCNTGELRHADFRFKPDGRLRTFHEAKIPQGAGEDVKRLSGGGLSARLFVGLKVGQRTAWNTSDVIKIVWSTRKKQGRSGDASILAQKGIYEDFKGKRVVEPSVQVIIIDFSGATKQAFINEMSELGETLCKKLKQETVILEIQKRGITSDVFSVTR